MDSNRFDTLVKLLALERTRRGLTAGLAVLAAAGAPAFEEATAKKRKRRKKKKKPPAPPPPPCRTLLQTCSGNCCGGLTCEDVQGCSPPDAPSGPYCCANTGGDCQASCDCCGNLRCSERHDDTCQDCGFPQDECFGDDNDCCFPSSICGDNFCEDFDVCCQGLRAECFEECDCCGASTLCGDNGCDDGDSCCQDEGFFCSGNCDCCDPLNCSEQVPGTLTCQDCSLPQDPCETENDCCLIASVCETVQGCGTDTICCQETGAICFDDCDCCGDDLCEGNPGTCVDPQRETGAAERARGAGKSASHGSTRVRWSRR